MNLLKLWLSFFCLSFIYCLLDSSSVNSCFIVKKLGQELGENDEQFSTEPITRLRFYKYEVNFYWPNDSGQIHHIDFLDFFLKFVDFRILVIFSDFIHLYLPYCESFFLYFFRSEHIPSGLENILIIKSGDLIKIKFFYSFSQSELTFFRLRNQKNVSNRKHRFERITGIFVVGVLTGIGMGCIGLDCINWVGWFRSWISSLLILSVSKLFPTRTISS